jgi:hypothetical protein
LLTPSYHWSLPPFNFGPMRPDYLPAASLSLGSNPLATEAEIASTFFHRFISADRAEPGPEPAFVLLHDSGANEEQLLSMVEAGAEDGKSNVITLRGLFEYEKRLFFSGNPK